MWVYKYAIHASYGYDNVGISDDICGAELFQEMGECQEWIFHLHTLLETISQFEKQNKLV